MTDPTDTKKEKAEKSRKVNERQIDFLKPCPFCGADQCELTVKEDEHGPFIYCACCDSIYTLANGTLEMMMEGWNRRVGE